MNPLKEARVNAELRATRALSRFFDSLIDVRDAREDGRHVDALYSLARAANFRRQYARQISTRDWCDVELSGVPR